jgi:hypothetical protein
MWAGLLELALPGGDGDVRGEIAACRLACHGNTGGITAEGLSVLEHPGIGRDGILVGCRELVLGCVAILHRHHDGIGLLGESQSRGFVGVRSAMTQPPP